MNEWKPDPRYAISSLLQSLRRLALPAVDQIAWLQRARIPSDELALDYEAAMDILWILRDAGILDDHLQAKLKEIDALLDEIGSSENSDEWTDEGLANSPNWARVRTMAQHVISDVQELIS